MPYGVQTENDILRQRMPAGAITEADMARIGTPVPPPPPQGYGVQTESDASRLSPGILQTILNLFARLQQGR